jgi:hypothetical protein
MIQVDLLGQLALRIRTDEKSVRQVYDFVRRKWVAFTPEEHVRQAWLHYLVHRLHYPPALIAVERQIQVGAMTKRFDIVVYDRDHHPWLLAECKAPDVPVGQNTLFQLLQYQSVTGCRYWLLSNGLDSFCADACDLNHVLWLEALPVYTPGPGA